MSKKNTERDGETLPEGQRSFFLLFLLLSGLAVFTVSTFITLSSLYVENVNLPSLKAAFAGVIASAAMIGTAVFLREKEAKRIAETSRKKALEKLSRGIAHDFNNILACFDTYATFLLEDLDDASKQHSFAERILEANGRAKAIITKIHDNPSNYEEEE